MAAAEQAEKKKAIYEQATIGFVTRNICSLFLLLVAICISAFLFFTGLNIADSLSHFL
jgi:hypothetical protein